MNWKVRAFVENPGGAYNPAPLNEFDLEPNGVFPAAGDYIRWDSSGSTYKVVARHFEYSEEFCYLMVEQAEPRWHFD